MGERLGGVRPLPRLQPGDPQGHLQHERDRQQRWSTRWKPALNAFAITFEGRIDINVK